MVITGPADSEVFGQIRRRIGVEIEVEPQYDFPAGVNVFRNLGRV